MGEYDFAKLEPRVKHISEGAIRKKWKRLPSSSHTVTREIIWSAREQSRTRRKVKANDFAGELCVKDVVSE